MTESPRDFLLDVDGPAVDTPVKALGLLAELVAEPEPTTAHERAGNRRRRAYIWANLVAAGWLEFEPAAARAVADWAAAEQESDRIAVLAAAGYAAPAAG